MSSPPLSMPAGTRPIRILVVQNGGGAHTDDAAWLHGASVQLALAGRRIECRFTSAAAIAALAQGAYAVVMLDAHLEGGGDVLARAASGGAAVVMIARHYDNRTIAAALQNGVHTLLSTPMSAADAISAIESAIESRTNSRDDVPAIEIVSARATWLEVLVACTLPAEERLLGFLTRLHPDLPEALRDSINQALLELLTNAVEWGGGLDPSRRVRVSCVRGSRLVLYRIADPGPGFRLDALPHAAVSNPVNNPLEHALVREQKKLRPGGFGISLVRGLVDELLYNEAHNEVVFVKYLT